jgi:hypothetical protein
VSLRQDKNYSQFFAIRSAINISMGFSPDPYLYQTPSGAVVLIQNVTGGLRSRALTVAENWRRYQVNVGPTASPLGGPLPVHMLYGLSPSLSLVPIEDNTMGHPEYLRLLYYGTAEERAAGHSARYAAMLQIL